MLELTKKEALKKDFELKRNEAALQIEDLISFDTIEINLNIEWHNEFEDSLTILGREDFG